MSAHEQHSHDDEKRNRQQDSGEHADPNQPPRPDDEQRQHPGGNPGTRKQVRHQRARQTKGPALIAIEDGTKARSRTDPNYLVDPIQAVPRPIPAALRRLMKVVHCPCGEVFEADTDDELVEKVQLHVQKDHPELENEYTREKILSIAHDH